MTKKRKMGFIMLIVPIPLLIVLLASYAVFNFVIASLIVPGEVNGTVIIIGNLTSIIFGFLGIFAVIGILLMPVGLVLLIIGAKKESEEGEGRE